jgi:hypothetical protein
MGDLTKHAGTIKMTKKSTLQTNKSKEEVRQRKLTSLLLLSCSELSDKFARELEMIANEEVGDESVDRTDLSLACSFITAYHRTNHPIILTLTERTIELLEWMAKEEFSAEVGRSIQKLCDLFGAGIPSVVSKEDTTSLAEYMKIQEDMIL